MRVVYRYAPFGSVAGGVKIGGGSSLKSSVYTNLWWGSREGEGG
jgi:hypothetical protein